MDKIFVFGHKNPDTDSVTSAIALSYLKSKLGFNAEPRVLGDLNKETEFVLNYFKFEEPKYLSDVKVQIEDVPYKRSLMINEKASIYEAYTYMVDNGITGLPVVGDKKKFLGYVSLKEIATDLIRGDFDYLNSSYENLLKVLDGQKITKFSDEVSGRIIAATYSSSVYDSEISLNGAIVIVGNRKHVLDACISNRAKLIIVVGNQELSKKDISRAEKNKVSIISTKKEAFEVAKVIGLSNLIKTIVRNESPVVFAPKDYLTDFYEISNKLKHTNYPILDKRNVCNGMLRLLDLNHHKRKKVILIDHNDSKQSVDGLSEASILEIIDHHAIGNLTTNIPISFRNMSVGSSNTIVYHMFIESHVKIPKNIAGIMLAGILSDTLILKSPTTTETDVHVASELAKISKLDIKKFGMEMLKAGSSLEGLSIEDIVFNDYKEFQANENNFGIGQIITMDYEKVLERKDEVIEFLDKTCEIKGFKLMALFITDVVNNGSYILYSKNAEKILSLAYSVDNLKEGHFLPGVISRKKQMVPNISGELENMD